jgi:hypothetical protein
MRFSVIMGAAVLAAVPAVAEGQDSVWGFFDAAGGSGAGVQGADGNQLLFKCDKPGKREVYAIIVSASKELGAASITTNPISRPISFRFDGKPPVSDNWRFYPKTAAATGKTADRALPRFVAALSGASKLDLLLDTGLGAPVPMSFNVTGAGDAIKTVYDKCKDQVPAA